MEQLNGLQTEIEAMGRDPDPIWGRGKIILYSAVSQISVQNARRTGFSESENDYFPIVVGNIYRRRTANNQPLKEEIREGEDDA